MYRLLLFVAVLCLFTSCTERSRTEKEATVRGRWFTRHQFELGKQVFMNHCASCHGIRAQGTVEDWKQPNPDGSFPPPPLDGTAHAWHHSLDVLVGQIKEGGIPLGGTMPAFGDSLSDGEIIAVIAYFQSYWDERTYTRWVEMNADQ